jgi:uncharacterized protein (DUF1330 family)
MEIEPSVNLCVLLWANEGCESALIRYEDEVMQIVATHGGEVLQRARTGGTGGEPFEIHLLRFPSETSLDQYLRDERRTSLAPARDHAVGRTQVLRVDLI